MSVFLTGPAPASPVTANTKILPFAADTISGLFLLGPGLPTPTFTITVSVAGSAHNAPGSSYDQAQAGSFTTITEPSLPINGNPFGSTFTSNPLSLTDANSFLHNLTVIYNPPAGYAVDSTFNVTVASSQGAVTDPPATLSAAIHATPLGLNGPFPTVMSFVGSSLSPSPDTTSIAPFAFLSLTDSIGSSALATLTVTPHGLLDSAVGTPGNKGIEVAGSVAITDPAAAMDGSTIDPATGAITITAPIGAVNSFLTKLRVSVPALGVVDRASLTFSAKDFFGGSSSLTTDTYFRATTLASATKLTITGTQAGQEIGRRSGPITPFANVTIADKPVPVTVTVRGETFKDTFEVSGNNTVPRQFSLGNVQFIDPNAASDGGTTSATGYTIAGTAAYVTQVLRDLQLSTPSVIGDEAHLTISASDSAGMATIDTTTTLFPGSADPTPTFRFFDKSFGTHFFTADASERDTILATRPDLVEETNNFGSVSFGSVGSEQVYRFFDTVHGTHFFTANATERDTILASRPDLKWEATASFYDHAAQQAGDVAVYRFFDTKLGTHFYTGDQSEYQGIVTAGSSAYRPDLKYEGIEFYAPAGTSR